MKTNNNLIEKNPLELRFDSGGFFVLMVIFCKNRSLSEGDIDKKRKRSRIKFIIKIKEDILMWKKLLALIMSLCMVAGMGITAFASETD